MEIDAAVARQREHPRGNNASISYHDDDIRLNRFKLRAEFRIVTDLVGLRDRQARSERGLLYRRGGHLLRSAYGFVRLRDHERQVMIGRQERLERGHGETRRSAEDEPHGVTRRCITMRLRAASCGFYAGRGRA